MILIAASQKPIDFCFTTTSFDHDCLLCGCVCVFGIWKEARNWNNYNNFRRPFVEGVDIS